MRIFFRQGFEKFFFAARNAAALIFENKVCAADEHLFTLNHTGNTVSNNTLHMRMILLMVQSSPSCLLHNSVCYGMRIMLLQAGCKAQHVVFGMISECYYLRYLRCGMGQSACLIKNNGVCPRHSLQKASALYGYAVAVTLTHGR